MYIFFHLLTGIILGFLLSDLLHDCRWLIPCAIGSILPDLIDKPVGFLLFPETIGYGRIYTHTLLVTASIFIAGAMIWYWKRNPVVLGLGVGVLSHQVLDQMWLEPVNWYYPLLGSFKGKMSGDALFTLIAGELHNPFEWILALLLLVGVLAFFYRERFLSDVRNQRRNLSGILEGLALILCICAGVVIGMGLVKRTLPAVGWSGPVEYFFAGVVIALASLLAWRWRYAVKTRSAQAGDEGNARQR
ncbi:MAG: metal-dependent hydrolase [Methanoregula sp.]|nr:metal-dependent hydrolase [Methanoregula sp.]